MELFHSLVDQLIVVLSSIGVESSEIKAAFVAVGLEPLWDELRNTYFNPYYALFVFPLWLIVGHFWPVKRPTARDRSNVFLDFVYPILSIPIEVFVVLSGIVLVSDFLASNVPFLYTRILDDQPILVQAIGAFLITDLMFYVAHVLKHKVPWLWYFHAIHHSQTHLNLFTTHRNHPIEAITDAAIKTIPIAIVGGAYPAVGLFLLFNNMWGYYIHANVRTNMGILKYVLVTPQNHRLHHTIRSEQIDHNYGERLTLWDWLFGTLWKDFDEYPATGIEGSEYIDESGENAIGILMAWILQMAYPFYRIWLDLYGFAVRLKQRLA